MTNATIQYQVKVVDAFKYYGEHGVLNGINMNVPACTIYGLLGPSGCGKSTLLQCILGTKALDHGYIDLKAKRLNEVGYMPQELCLDANLTVKETFEYYGTIFKMSKQQIKTRIDELNKFLHFPNINSFIGKISGGQSKRISLAVALMHNPKFLILDEPTVGIDVLLRQEIWAEFIKMTKQDKKTIIITTHYIEEANEANCIGLMRNGMLVEEGSPQNIITTHCANTLEDAFLSLCYRQKTNQIVKKNVPANEKKKPNNVLLSSGNNIDFHRVKALTKKYSRLFSRDLLLFFTVIWLPILQYNNFNFSIGSNIKNMSIAIKNDEVNYLDCQHFNVSGCIIDENSNLTMSCVVLNYLTSLNSYTFDEVNDREIGELRMNNPKYMAFLYFPKTYTRALANYIDSHNDTDGESLIYARLTMDNLVFRNQIKTDVLNSINYLLEKTLIGCSNNPKAIGMPMAFKIIYGNEIKSLGQSMVHIFIALSIFYLSSLTSGSIMMSEKLNGSLNRSLFSGVKLMECVISLFLLITILQLFQIFCCCFMFFVCYSNPVVITSGLFTYMLLLLFLGWTGFFIGICLVVISRSQLANIYLLTGVSLSQFLLPGLLWPLEGQVYFLRKLSEILPIRIAGNTMANIALKGWTLEHPAIITGTTVTFGYIVLLVIILIIFGKLKKNMWVSN